MLGQKLTNVSRLIRTSSWRNERLVPPNSRAASIRATGLSWIDLFSFNCNSSNDEEQQ